jgi:hypothetical protein
VGVPLVSTLAYTVEEVTVPKKIKYRKELFQAIDAFLEGTPSALERAQRIIQRCYVAKGEEELTTLNYILWSAFITPLTDSVFYKHKPFLRETREILLGSSSIFLIKRSCSTYYFLLLMFGKFAPCCTS